MDLIKVLTGVRRCGKSILLEQIKEEFIENGFDRAHIITIVFYQLFFSPYMLKICKKLQEKTICFHQNPCNHYTRKWGKVSKIKCLQLN